MCKVLILHHPVKHNSVYNNQPKQMFLESSSMMKARQDVYTAVLKTGNALSCKTLPAELFNDCSVCSWHPHDWLDSWKHFWDLKLENEGGNLFSTLPSMGKWSHSCCDVGNYNICFFSTLGFNKSVCIHWKRVIVALFCRLHRSRWGNYHFCGLWLWRYVSVQCLLSVFFLAPWSVNVFLTLNFTASIIYRFFSLSVTYGIFALWFSLNKMYVIKVSVSFDTDQIEREEPHHCML